MDEFHFGFTLADNTPCVLWFGDSVLCTFPGLPRQVAVARAKAVVDRLNANPHAFEKAYNKHLHIERP